MLDSLYKKLHLLFIGGMAGIFSLIAGILLFNQISGEKNNELSYAQRMTTLIIYQLENNREHFAEVVKNYEQPGLLLCSVKTAGGETFYRGVSSFPTSTDFLLSAIGGQAEISYTPFRETGNKVTDQAGPFLLDGQKGDRYLGIPADVVSKDDAVYRLVVFFRTQATASLLRRLAPLYLLIWVLSLLGAALLGHFVLKQAFKPSRQAFNSQKEFIASASHELKSPLAVLFSHIEKLSRSGEVSSEIAGSAVVMNRECRRMTRLVNDLLLLASSDAKAWSARKKEINLDTLLISLYENYEAVCAGRGITLKPDIREESYPLLFSDPELIRRILSIFLDNAIAHSGDSPEIGIRAALTARTVTFEIIDHGKGISEQDKPFLFDRFYRADRSRTDKTHFGLGLSIAKELAALLAGKVGFRDVPGGGACFYLTIPIR